ncbi:MAG TPA: aminodeoxychorismate synthase component I [Wenzhouxiangellaceae bacterium]|nr:aminodeoxychorismate synthase component I [Wenzhouxiangellaceae bacterium]
MNNQLRLPGRPDLLAVHRSDPDTWPFLLDSASRGGSLGRWSILMRVDPDQAPIVGSRDSIDEFLPRLDRAFDAQRCAQAGRLPFEGGWFVYLGYELIGEIEPRLNPRSVPDGTPQAFARRCNAALILDHETGEAHAVAEAPGLLAAIAEEVADTPPLPDSADDLELPVMRPDDGERFMHGVERIREYILAGDVFQVNLSRAWQGLTESAPDPVEVYRRLSASNPAPFAGLARLPGGTLLSSSPERLVSVHGRVIEARPIAGTRPRGDSPEHDRALSSELLGHPKERAEHIMLIDLERNDLGRICVPGTVEVDELMIVESYTHVHHIVSNIRGRLRDDVSPADVIRACFPGGTITGCPKVRCMEIIAELETAGRGFYTGSMGYLGLDGHMDLNILIRSMLVSERGIRFRTGAGIVADSEPAAELAETEAKARGLMRALNP